MSRCEGIIFYLRESKIVREFFVHNLCKLSMSFSEEARLSGECW